MSRALVVFSLGCLGGCAGLQSMQHDAGGPPPLVRFEAAPIERRENDRYVPWVSVRALVDGVTLTDFSFTVFNDDGDGMYQEVERLRQAGGWGLTARSEAEGAGLAVPPVTNPWIRAWALTSRGPVEASWPLE